MTTTTNRSTFDTERLSSVLAGAMFDVASVLCDDIAIDAGRNVETLTASDIIAAMRLPVSMATAYHDLCERLGIPTPYTVWLALGTDER